MSGVVVWLTGLPASGKSTLAARIRDRLGPCPILDSDEVRVALGWATYDDRDAFYAALGRLAAVLAAQDQVVLVAATASRRRYRDATRAIAPGFIEVHVQTPIADCERRDRKGLYVRAHGGEAPRLPGVGEPYEPPLAPEVVARDGRDDRAVAAVVGAVLAARGLMPTPIIARYMTASPIVVPHDTSLANATRILADRKIRHLPVVDRDRVVGLIDARELELVEAIGQLDAESTRVERVMRGNPYVVASNASLSEVVETMAARKLDAAIVVNGGVVCGIFTTVDLCTALALSLDPAA